ncbi:MAG: hypothetical protein ACP5PJ_09660 [Acidimicrobiales bacterium]
MRRSCRALIVAAGAATGLASGGGGCWFPRCPYEIDSASLKVMEFRSKSLSPEEEIVLERLSVALFIGMLNLIERRILCIEKRSVVLEYVVVDHSSCCHLRPPWERRVR